MPITPLALIIVIMHIVNVIKLSHRNFIIYALTITIAVTLFIRMGYFLKIGTLELSYPSVLIYFLGLISFLYLTKKSRRIKLKFIKWFIIFLLFLLVGYIGLLVEPHTSPIYTGQWETLVLTGQANLSTVTALDVKVGYYLIFIFSGFILLLSRHEIKKNEWIIILRKIISIGKFYCCLGYIELIMVNLFHNKFMTNLYISICGISGSHQNWLTERAGLYTIQGATKEPSMYSTSIFYLIILMLLDIYIRPDKKKKIWLIATILLLLINPAMSCFVYLCVLLIIVYTLGLLEKKKLSDYNSLFRFTSIILLSFILLIFLWGMSYLFLLPNNYFFSRITTAFEQLYILINGLGYGSYSSEGIRFTGIFYVLGLVLERPFLGFGLGSVSCNSGIVNFITNLGLIGFMLWVIMLYNFCEVDSHNKKEKLFFIGIVFFPNLFLNDYETVMCLVIPFAGICFGYISKIDG